MRKSSKQPPSLPAGFRPEDAPLGSLESRVAARARLHQNQKRYRVIFYGYDAIPLKLENSFCERQIWPDGSLFEYIELDGRVEDLTEEQLQAFIDRHPIKHNRTTR